VFAVDDLIGCFRFGVMRIDPSALDHRLEALRAFARWPVAEVDRFGRVLESRDAWQLFRINPLDFAEREQFDIRVAIDLFIHGSKVGLFDLVWSCVCVFCGAVEYTYDSVDRVPSRSFHCTRCNADIASWLDERVEVSFSLHASVAELDIDPFADIASYERYHTSPSVVHDADNAAFVAGVVRSHALLAADQDAELDIELPPEGSLRLLSYDRHAHVLLTADGHATADPSKLELDLLTTGFARDSLSVPAGRLLVRLINRAPKPTGVVVLDGDVERFHDQLGSVRASIRPFFSGQMLLCSESFRRLFRVQTIDEELALNVRHVALLFTDLVASTELYDRIGDAAAYTLVRRHFRELHAATEACAGAVVKTMGDAIMSAFDRPADAVRAGLDMLARMERLHAELPADKAVSAFAWGLRVGVHAGPAIVVHADGRLDYFGQVVNVAARLQSLAEPGTLYLSADVLHAPGVAEVLADRTGVGMLEPAEIRGVTDVVSVCRVSPSSHVRH
jgi:class 3 adenylate cyclase